MSSFHQMKTKQRYRSAYVITSTFTSKSRKNLCLCIHSHISFCTFVGTRYL